MNFCHIVVSLKMSIFCCLQKIDGPLICIMVGFQSRGRKQLNLSIFRRKCQACWLCMHNVSIQFWLTAISLSMTTLLMHTVAHSTKPSFMHKTNNQPHKKFLSLSLSWAKSVKNGKILTFKVNFLCQKISKSF